MTTTTSKSCIKCGGSEFYANGACKSCARARAKAYQAANPEKVKVAKKKWSKANSEKNKARSSAYRAAYPDRRKATNAAYRSSHSDQIKASGAAYYLANTKKCNADGAVWNAANPERKRATAAAYYEANVGKIKEYRTTYRAEHGDKARAATLAWNKANPERVKSNAAKYAKANAEQRRIAEQNRRAKKKANGGVLSKGLSKKLFKLQKGKCACCGKPLGDGFHLDHIVALAAGGSNTDDNIQLLSATCNLQKSTKDPVDFMQSRGFLL